MKYYRVGSTSCININIEEGDEFTSYEGTSFEDAKKALENEKWKFEKYLTQNEKKRTIVWGRVYDIPDDTDLNDEYALSNALCDCLGYNDID